MKTHSKTKNEMTRKCVKRVATVCSAILRTTKQNENAVLLRPHNHIADQTTIETEKVGNEMKEVASTSNDKPNQILTFYAATAPAGPGQATSG